ATARRTWTPPSRRRWRSTTCRSSSTSSSTRTPWSGRWSRPARATTTSRSPGTWPRSGTPTTEEGRAVSKHTLSVLVENRPGVLARVASLFSRRGFNIDSLADGPTEHDEISRMTIVVNVEDQPLEQVTKQLNMLVNVLKIVELDPAQSVQRELMLIKARADAGSRSHVLELVQLFRAR